MKCEHPDHVDGKSCEDYAVGCHKDCPCCCPPEKQLANQPPPGSWAAVARMMASLGDDDGMDWDAWKDEMKERDMP